MTHPTQEDAHRWALACQRVELALPGLAQSIRDFAAQRTEPAPDAEADAPPNQSR